MIVLLDPAAPQSTRDALSAAAALIGSAANELRYDDGAAVVAVEGDLPADVLALPGVRASFDEHKGYMHASKLARERSVVMVGDVAVGGDEPVVMAGPCVVEGREETLAVARAVRDAGATVLRGGAFKPRTSPYAFQGLGELGLRHLAEARDETGLPVVTEVMEPEQVGLVAHYADMLQVGSRNMQNYPLLRKVGAAGKPVLLKRGFQATVEEWLMAAEYVLAAGNPNVVLCERGIRAFDPAFRFTLDLNAVPAVKELTHLPVVVDPSHGTGKRSLVASMALAGIAAGADGLIVEVHPAPETARCDAAQTVTPETLAGIVRRARLVREVVVEERVLA